MSLIGSKSGVPRAVNSLTGARHSRDEASKTSFMPAPQGAMCVQAASFMVSNSSAVTHESNDKITETFRFVENPSMETV